MEGRLVTVEINGQRYPIRTELDASYVAELAAYVQQKMELAARESPAGDTLKIAVLAALNIAERFLPHPLGVFRASVESHFPLALLNDWDVTADYLARFAVVVLPNATALSDAQVKALQGQQGAKEALDNTVARGNRVLREFERSARS